MEEYRARGTQPQDDWLLDVRRFLERNDEVHTREESWHSEASRAKSENKAILKKEKRGRIGEQRRKRAPEACGGRSSVHAGS